MKQLKSVVALAMSLCMLLPTSPVRFKSSRSTDYGIGPHRRCYGLVRLCQL